MRSTAGRKREINIARRSGELGSGMRRGNGGWGPHRGLELELDGSPARKIHIFKYFSHGPQSPRHAALPPTLPAAHYVPTTYQVRAWASPRVRRAVSGFLVTRCRFLSVSLSLFLFLSLFCNYPVYYGAQHASVLCSPVGVCVRFMYRTAPRL